MTSPKPSFICCVAGKSGGHIIPCLTLAQKALNSSGKIIFFSSASTLDSHILQNYPELSSITALTIMNIPSNQWWKLPLFAGQVVRSFVISLVKLIKNRPKRIISTGGFTAIPVCLAGFVLRIPIDLYELNTTPGRAIVFLAPFATRLFVCFSKTKLHFKRETILTHYPIRFSTASSSDLSTTLTWYNPHKKTILILGGSQGSQFINHQICAVAPLFGSSIQIIHQTGIEHVDTLSKFYKSLNIEGKVFAYEQNLAPYLRIADIVVCRAGAGTLFETLYFKKKCIAIPLETHSTDHQLENAQTLAEYYPEFFTVIRQRELIHDQLKLFNTLSRCLG